MSTRLVIVFVLAASLQGQVFQSMPSARASAPSPFDPRNPPRAEDSPASAADNEIFYGNPRGPELRPAPEPAGAVSVEQLRHPISRKAAGMLRKAQNLAASGRHAEAIAQLQLAVQDRSAAPYAHSMLGVEYLKTGQTLAAIAELEQAAALLPRNEADLSNLGYAYFLAGDLDQGEQEARRALELDRDNPKTRRVLAQILAARRLRKALLP